VNISQSVIEIELTGQSIREQLAGATANIPPNSYVRLQVGSVWPPLWAREALPPDATVQIVGHSGRVIAAWESALRGEVPV
jgi:hypothetical protein